MVFLLKILLNRLSLLKCLSRRFRKYFSMLMLVSLQTGGLNQITFLFLFLPRQFEWLFFGVTYVDEFVDPTTAASVYGDVLSLRVQVYVLQSTLKSAIFKGFIIYPFVLLKIIFYMRLVYLSSGSLIFYSFSLFSKFWGPSQAHQLKSVSSSLSYSIVFLCLL